LNILNNWRDLGRFVLPPISDLTHGNATHSYPTAWKQYLAELLEQTKHS
jgi:hypothetical protein